MSHAQHLIEHQSTDRVRLLIHEAYQIAKLYGHNFIGTEHILLAMTVPNPGGCAFEILRSLGIETKIQPEFELLLDAKKIT